MCPKLCPVCPVHSGQDHACPCPVLSDMAPIGTIRPAVQLLGVGHCKITVGLSDHCGYLSCETCVLRDDYGHERVCDPELYAIVHREVPLAPTTDRHPEWRAEAERAAARVNQAMDVRSRHVTEV